MVYFFRIPISSCDGGERIDRSVVEAAVVGDAVFGPMIHRLGIRDELSLIDSNIALPWVAARHLARCSRLDDHIITGLWLQMAFHRAFKWFKRVSSHWNLADRPSRSLEPECPRGWCPVELRRVRRSDPVSDGDGPDRAGPSFSTPPY